MTRESDTFVKIDITLHAAARYARTYVKINADTGGTFLDSNGNLTHQLLHNTSSKLLNCRYYKGFGLSQSTV